LASRQTSRRLSGGEGDLPMEGVGQQIGNCGQLVKCESPLSLSLSLSRFDFGFQLRTSKATHSAERIKKKVSPAFVVCKATRTNKERTETVQLR
jgi:hypothetical protein